MPYLCYCINLMDNIFGHFYIFLSHWILSFKNYLYIDQVLELAVLYNVCIRGPPLSTNIHEIHTFSSAHSVGQHFIVFQLLGSRDVGALSYTKNHNISSMQPHVMFPDMYCFLLCRLGSLSMALHLFFIFSIHHVPLSSLGSILLLFPHASRSSIIFYSFGHPAIVLLLQFLVISIFSYPIRILIFKN